MCQSCGMPFRGDEDLGTNADGSKSSEYCRFCYQKGEFIDEVKTLEEKINKMVEVAKKMGVSEEEARKIAEKLIPKLKRWK